MSPLAVNGTKVADHKLTNEEVHELATVLRDQILSLSTLLPRSPSLVRVSARGVELEVGWPVGEQSVAPVAAPVAGAAPAASAADTPVAEETNTFSLCANMVGVFYRAPEPGAKSFVEEGDTVQPGQQVAITEAMKLMVPVKADRQGTVVEILVADGESVEHGQPLMTFAPIAGGAQ